MDRIQSGGTSGVEQCMILEVTFVLGLRLS